MLLIIWSAVACISDRRGDPARNSIIACRQWPRLSITGCRSTCGKRRGMTGLSDVMCFCYVPERQCGGVERHFRHPQVGSPTVQFSGAGQICNPNSCPWCRFRRWRTFGASRYSPATIRARCGAERSARGAPSSRWRTGRRQSVIASLADSSLQRPKDQPSSMMSACRSASAASWRSSGDIDLGSNSSCR